MAHELDTTADNKAAIAYVGEVPWHGMGQRLTPGLPLSVWKQQAGLDWRALESRVQFDVNGALKSAEGHKVLYRSDTGGVLSIVSDQYRPVQPDEILEFYRDLTTKYGFELETAGSLKGGRRVWALANTKNAFQLAGKDEQKLYLLLATSFDKSLATQARLTAVRVVCNNTMQLATQGSRADSVVPHSTKFDPDKVKLELKIGGAWEIYQRQAEAMVKRQISPEETARFILDVYLGLDTPEKIAEHRDSEFGVKQVEKLTARFQKALFEAPGAHLASARGLLWGVVNAVTRDVDFQKPARSNENRLNSAWFGPGNRLKERAWEKAVALCQ